MDLSPLAAARSIIREHAAPPVSAPGAAANDRAATSDPSRQPVPSPYSAAPDPVLEREADGSYRFEGTGIRATIARNGDVSFGSRYLSGPRLGLRQPVDPAASKDTGFTDRAFFASNTVVITGSVDYDFTLRHDAEKRWFLERTRTLRDQLAERARRPKDLLGVLKTIWSGAGNFADHRRATLALWAGPL